MPPDLLKLTSLGLSMDLVNAFQRRERQQLQQKQQQQQEEAIRHLRSSLIQQQEMLDFQRHQQETVNLNQQTPCNSNSSSNNNNQPLDLSLKKSKLPSASKSRRNRPEPIRLGPNTIENSINKLPPLTSISSSTSPSYCSHSASSISSNELKNEIVISSTSKKQRGAGSKRRKNHLCHQCGRLFSRSDMLTRHSRLHSGLKPYQCAECKQVFSRSDHLSTHERTHTGVKPYQCDHCSYSACRRDMITRHKRIHGNSCNRQTRRRTNSANLGERSSIGSRNSRSTIVSADDQEDLSTTMEDEEVSSVER